MTFEKLNLKCIVVGWPGYHDVMDHLSRNNKSPFSPVVGAKGVSHPGPKAVFIITSNTLLLGMSNSFLKE